MTTLAREFSQENLISISKVEYSRIRDALKRNRLLSFSKGSWTGGDKFGWIMKSEPSNQGQYLLVEHYVSKTEGGLALAYKVDAEMYKAFQALD